MDRFTANQQSGADAGGTTEDTNRLQARLSVRQAEWVSAISYWCDYLTIIDLQGLNDPALRRAS